MPALRATADYLRTLGKERGVTLVNELLCGVGDPLKVGILTQWFDPEPGGAAIPGALARELSRRGHDVVVLTGFPNYPSGHIYPGFRMSARQDLYEAQTRIRRVAVYPSHDASASRRLLNYGSFALTSSALGLTALKGMDVLWVYNSPASIAVPMWLSKYLFKVPHVLHVMDLWPDSILETAFGGSSAVHRVIQKSLGYWVNGMYRSAASVAYITPGVGRELARRGVPASKLQFAPVWADETVAQGSSPADRSQWGVTDDEVLILYAGTMGDAQGLESLIDAMALTRERAKVTLLMAGTGTAREALRIRSWRLGLENVHFLGQVPRSEMAAVMSAADVHVVSLRDTPLSLITMPSKIQTTLAIGKPFISAVGGDAAWVASESGAGIPAVPGNAESLADAIQHAARAGRSELLRRGQRGQQYYSDHFSLTSGVDRIELLLRHAAGMNS